MHKDFDLLIFIGRFQPFHKGHQAVIEEGLHRSTHVLVLVGSSDNPRSTRNPWSFAERQNMILQAFTEADQQHLHVAPLKDVMYNDHAWVKAVQTSVEKFLAEHYCEFPTDPKIGLIGHSKDKSSYYLNLFPQWQAVPVENYEGISATPIREAFFTDEMQSELPELKEVPSNVHKHLSDFLSSEDYANLHQEHDFIQKYKTKWADLPYPPTYVTVDAVVVQSGHILLVERRSYPGKGLWALPGGFVGHDEKLLDACIRELREETRLKVPEPVLRGVMKKSEVFDEPNRSTRGRTITHAFYFPLRADKYLPQVKGGDKIARAFWVPLAKLDPSKIFEDHYHIIQTMVGM